MKNLIKISTLLVIIIAINFTACKKDIIQTDKPLYDVLVDKTWEWKWEKTKKSTDTIIYKYHIWYRKDSIEMWGTKCDNVHLDSSINLLRWEVKGDTILTIGNIWKPIDTTFLIIDTYSETKISGVWKYKYLKEVKVSLTLCE